MQDHKKIIVADKETFYKILNVKLEGLLASESNWLANLSNASAHLYTNLETINWAGFYFINEEELILGPFQGRTACTRIKIGNGVCGTAIAQRATQLVPDVHLFPGHIACDGASSSEIVIPIIKDGFIYGVMDIDSPIKERFDEIDLKYLEAFVQKLNKYIDWKNISSGISVAEL